MSKAGNVTPPNFLKKFLKNRSRLQTFLIPPTLSILGVEKRNPPTVQKPT